MLPSKTTFTITTTLGASATITTLAYALGAPRYWLAGLAAAATCLLIAILSLDGLT